MKTYAKVEAHIHTFLTLALDEDKWSASCFGHFTSEYKPLVPIG